MEEKRAKKPKLEDSSSGTDTPESCCSSIFSSDSNKGPFALSGRDISPGRQGMQPIVCLMIPVCEHFLLHIKIA